MLEDIAFIGYVLHFNLSEIKDMYLSEYEKILKTAIKFKEAEYRL